MVSKQQQVTNPGLDSLIVALCHEFGLHNLLPELKASVEAGFAPDAGEVPDVFVVAAKAPQVQKDAIQPGQFCCSIPTVASILHALSLTPYHRCPKALAGTPKFLARTSFGVCVPVRLSSSFHFLPGFIDHILLSFTVLLMCGRKSSCAGQWPQHFMVAPSQTGE